MLLPYRLFNGLIALLALAVLVTAVWLEPSAKGLGTHEQLGLPACGYLQATGRPCMSCGMTTAFSHMAEGAPMQAIDSNPMGAVLFLLTLIAVPWFGHAAWTGADAFRFFYHRIGRWLFPIVITGLLVMFFQRHFAW